MEWVLEQSCLPWPALRGVVGSARKVYLSSGSTPDPIDPVASRATADAYGTRKSKGSDHWGAGELASLPLGAIGHFTGLLDECVAKGVWPDQLHLHVMPVLGKPTGGERCVAKAPVLYRLWCKHTRAVVKDWETEHTATWDTAKQGSSAMWPALIRALKGELASGTGKAFGGSLWDLQKSFDLVGPVSLVKKRRPLTRDVPFMFLPWGFRCMSLLGCCSCWVRVRIPSMCAGASWLAVGLLSPSLGSTLGRRWTGSRLAPLGPSSLRMLMTLRRLLLAPWMLW